MTLLVAKGFRQEDFANRHPGGTLGKRLMRVDQLMRTGDDMPRVTPASQLADVVHEITQKAIGMTCVVDADNRLLGRHHRRRPAPSYGHPAPTFLDNRQPTS